jgi:outer membrane protein OmpA-like peptidoglycan-associated protein
MLTFQLAISQDNSKRIVPLSLGLYTGINMNMHSPAFNYPKDSNFVIPFDNNSTGLGFAIGFLGLFPINDMFVISGKIGYNGLGGILTKDSFELDASLNYIEISPELQIHNLLPLKDVYLIAGLETGIPLSPKYSLTKTNIENENIPDASFRMAGAFGVGYFWEISKGINLTPELTFKIPFTKVSDNNNFKTWDVPQLRFGIGLSFALETLPETFQEDPPSLNLGFKEVRYYNNEGNTYPLERIRVEDLSYTEQFPIVPMVFFDEQQKVPSTKMQSLFGKSSAGEFSIQNLIPEAISINNNTLDIVGKRMNENQNAELTITGTLDNMNEKNQDLALQRATFAKDYLTKNYDIHPERINVRAVGLPEKPSTSKDPDGVAENRRLELSSSNPNILAPILIQKENQTLAEPNLIEFVPFIESTDSILEWKLSINQKGQEIRSFAGTDEPGDIAWVIIPNELVKSEIPIEYVLWAKNARDMEKTAAGRIPVDYYSFSRKKTEDLADKTIAKYSLILFDFDSDLISNEDMNLINRDIIPAIKFNSTVKIFGYTDRIGDAKYNKELAKKRAETLKKYLVSKVKSAKYEVFGVGENELIFDNDLPLGRQLSRTVQIVISTPK